MHCGTCTKTRLYQDTQCTLTGSGSLSTPFTVGCGKRQGCPLSVTTLLNLFTTDLDAHPKSNCTLRTGVQVGVSIMGPQPSHPDRVVQTDTQVLCAPALHEQHQCCSLN